MAVARRTSADVTSELAWRSWASAERLRAPEWGEPGRAVVVVPSYADAVVAAGGTLCRLDAAGWRLRILVVTGRSPVADTLLVAGQVELVGEADGNRALRRLGLAAAPVCHVHVPCSGDVPDREHLVRLLAYELVGARWCMAPYGGEADPVRAAVGDAAEEAAAGAGARLAAFPVDVWSWAVPGQGELPWPRARAEPLDEDTTERKMSAVAELTTAAVAQGELVAEGPASRAWELFFLG